MFAGVVNQQILYSCHPVLVVCPKGVAAAFASLDAARRFVAGRGFRSGLIYRHDGSDWYKVTLPCSGGPVSVTLPTAELPSEANDRRADSI
jgi:hypothetical protein